MRKYKFIKTGLLLSLQYTWSLPSTVMTFSISPSFISAPFLSIIIWFFLAAFPFTNVPLATIRDHFLVSTCLESMYSLPDPRSCREPPPLFITLILQCCLEALGSSMTISASWDLPIMYSLILRETWAFDILRTLVSFTCLVLVWRFWLSLSLLLSVG